MNLHTKKREKAKDSPLKLAFRDFADTVRKVSIPTIKEWLYSFWRVLVIVACMALVITALDYGLLQASFGLQGVLPSISDSETIAYWYLGALIFTGILSVVGVLFQQGSSDGLTSLLGSGSQYQSSIAGAAKRISLFTLTIGTVFAVLCLFSPMFLEGMVS